jgi:hypothetical protein
MGPRANTVARRKIPVPAPYENRTPIVQPTISHFTDRVIPSYDLEVRNTYIKIEFSYFALKYAIIKVQENQV